MAGTIDLGETKQVQSFTAGTMENQRSWIFKPKLLVVETSIGGKTFKPAGRVNTHSKRDYKPYAVQIRLTINQPARWLRFRFNTMNRNPDWHHHPGGKSWFFLDELLVE